MWCKIGNQNHRVPSTLWGARGEEISQSPDKTLKGAFVHSVKIPTQRSFLYLVFFAVLTFEACGYQFQGGGTSLAPEIRSVAIPVFANRTPQTGMENEITRALVDKFTATRRLFVTSQSSADTLLTGTIKSFFTTSVTVTSATQVTTGYRATVTLEVVFQRKGDGKILWKEEIREWRNYAVVSDLAVTEGNKREAIRQISDLLAERVYEIIMGNF